MCFVVDVVHSDGCVLRTIVLVCLHECGPSSCTVHAYDSIEQLIAQFMCLCWEEPHSLRTPFQLVLWVRAENETNRNEVYTKKVRRIAWKVLEKIEERKKNIYFAFFEQFNYCFTLFLWAFVTSKITLTVNAIHWNIWLEKCASDSEGSFERKRFITYNTNWFAFTIVNGVLFDRGTLK